MKSCNLLDMAETRLTSICELVALCIQHPFSRCGILSRTNRNYVREDCRRLTHSSYATPRHARSCTNRTKIKIKRVGGTEICRGLLELFYTERYCKSNTTVNSSPCITRTKKEPPVWCLMSDSDILFTSLRINDMSVIFRPRSPSQIRDIVTAADQTN
jgi:hypothetical protein